MIKFFRFFILLFLFLQYSCGTWDQVKRGMTGQKKTSTDEFLVKKKDPLVRPPDYAKLPMPGNTNLEEIDDEEEEERSLSIKNLETTTESTLESGTVEENILRRIKKN